MSAYYVEELMKYFKALTTGMLGLTMFAQANATAQAISSAQNAMAIPKSTQDVQIDGILDDPIWRSAKVIEINNVTWPDENVPAPVSTKAYVVENGETLLVAFEAFDDNPEEIRAFLSDRDNNWNDDRVMLKIDTYNDHALAYQFMVNPLGTQADVIENEVTKRESPAWDGIWESAGQITSKGYIVEIAVPLRILNFDDGLDVQQWGMEFVRFYPRDKNLRISNARIDHNNPCWICQMPHVSGFKGAKQGKNLTIIPTLVSGTTETRDPLDSTSPGWENESNTDAGVDLKWGITPDVTLNVTLNPDFSQVESDSGQLNVNNSFALFLREKRTFFLENQDYFSAPINLIYTRNINDPDYGAKITGKKGNHSFAGFVANDQSTNLISSGNLSSSLYTVEQETQNTALRYRYQINDKLAVGALSTVRKSSGYRNTVMSFDAKYQPTANDTFDLQIIQSDNDYSDAELANLQEEFSYTVSCSLQARTNENTNEENQRCDELNQPGQQATDYVRFGEQYLRSFTINEGGSAYQLNYRHENRDWFFRARHESFDEDFRADLAFINQIDKTKSVLGGGYIWRGDSEDWWTRIELEGDWDISHNQAGEQFEQEWEMFLNISGPMQSFIRNGIQVRERISDFAVDDFATVAGQEFTPSSQQLKDALSLANSEEFFEKEFRSWMEFKPTANLWFGNFFKIGKSIDNANQRLADSIVWEPNFSWNVTKHLKTRIQYTYSNLSYDDKDVFTANLIDLRTTYQFSIKSFLRLSAVYTDIDRNLSNYVIDTSDYNENSKYLSAQLLYSYKVNPQTLFFVGYSESSFDNDALKSLTKDSRSVFFKISYAWLM